MKKIFTTLALALTVITSSAQTESDSLISFADEGLKTFCIKFNRIDTNKDQEISLGEAAASTRLSLMVYKSFMQPIKDYRDLAFFPNLQYLHAGLSYADTLDLSNNPLLEEIDASDCRKLSVIILRKGCKPEIKTGYWKGEKPKIIYKKKKK